MADVDFDGIVKEVCVECVPDAAIGDYVIVHVGFAIAKLNEEEAQRRLQTLTELSEFSQAQEALERGPDKGEKP